MFLRKTYRNLLYAAVSLILAGFIVVPVLTVFCQAVMIDGRLDFLHMVNLLKENGQADTIGNSILLGVSVVLTATVISFPLAWILARTPLKNKKWLDIVLMIPFMTPPYISSMGWILFMQKRGIFQQLFPATGSWSECFFSFPGLVLVMSFHVFPFMMGILKNALLNINPNLEESGAVFGGTVLYRMKKIMIPLLTGNYAIGALLVFVKTLSEYGTPATLGKRIGFYVFTTDIHRYATTSPIDFGKAAGLSSALVGICIIMWMVQSIITRKYTYPLVNGKASRDKVCEKKSVEILGSVYIGAVILVAVGIPYFSVIVTSLIKLRGYGIAAGNFTFMHYVELFTENTKGIRAILTSAGLAFAASTIAAVIGTMLVVSTRKAGIWKKLIEAESLLPEMLPNIVLVIGMMLFWNKIYQYMPIYNTMVFMVLCYVVMFLPYTVQYAGSSLMQIGDNLEQAGRTCGGNYWYVLVKIMIPLIWKGIATGWMMTFIIVFRELVAASLIAPPNVLTISTYIVREFEQGSVSVGMAMAVICVLLSTTALIILQGRKNGRKKS